MQRRIIMSWITPLIVLMPALSLFAAEPFLLKGGETIVFFGDSITQNGGYINYFEAYLLTRFPDKSFRVINHGINGQTISGTSEEDHDPPRQSAMPRFDRDVAAWKPDIVVVCFGMNDGNYKSFDDWRFRKYQDGIHEVMRRVKRQTAARLILMTPPPYDPSRRRILDPETKTFGYKFAAIDYDATLARYSQWLVSLRKGGAIVVDLHTAISKHVQHRRQKIETYSISPDAVHPNVTGHWLMAQELLQELNAPATVADLNLDFDKKTYTRDGVNEFKVFETADKLGTGVSCSWTTRLPLPLDDSWDRGALSLYSVTARLSRHRLKIAGFRPYEFGYSLRVNGKHMAIFSADGWKDGIELTQLPREKYAKLTRHQIQSRKLSELPTNVAARKLLAAVQDRRRLVYAAWRATIANKPVDAETTARVKALTRQIEELRRPQTLKIEVRPFPGI